MGTRNSRGACASDGRHRLQPRRHASLRAVLELPSSLALFDCMQDSLSTSFEGQVYPQTRFVFGPAEGCAFDKPNAKLTVNANTVWQHAPVVVELADGARENVGSEATRIVRWEVPPPELGGTIQFSDSQPLVRTPVWALVDFVDFSGICIVQVLGHD